MPKRKPPAHARILTHKGESLPLDRWATRTGIPAATIRSRLDYLRWSVADALATPVDRRFRGGGRHRADMPRPCPPARRHASGQAWARWKSAGQSFCRYFGAWGSEAAQAAYRRFQAEWAQGLAGLKSVTGGLTVAELVDGYTDHADRYYRKAGRVTSEAGLVRLAAGAFVALCADKAVADVTADDVRNLQTALAGRGLARTTVNKYVGIVVRMFGWGAGQTGAGGLPFVPIGVLGAVQNVAALAAGRTRAHDNPPVESVPWADVERTIPHLHADPARRAVLGAAVRVHWLTGMRSSELLGMRPADLDRRAAEWKYTVPAAIDKQAHKRKRPAAYWLGPKAQKVIAQVPGRLPGRSARVRPPAPARGRPVGPAVAGRVPAVRRAGLPGGRASITGIRIASGTAGRRKSRGFTSRTTRRRRRSATRRRSPAACTSTRPTPSADGSRGKPGDRHRGPAARAGKFRRDWLTPDDRRGMCTVVQLRII
jgi:integrase